MIPKGASSHLIELASENGTFKGTVNAACAHLVKPCGEGLEVRVGQMCHGVFDFKYGTHGSQNTKSLLNTQA